MSEENEQIKLIKDFIFDDNFQKELSEINNNLMDFNILEITGMGHQETKHSNILGWLFDDSEHNLEYKILEEFLKRVILQNKNNAKIEKIKEYIYLSHKQDLKIYREKDNIDLIIVDEKNKVVITIENKVFATEREDGDDGGQLKKYEQKINTEYFNYDKIFIFLTINLENPSQDNWLKASHQMITDAIEKIIKNNKDLSVKAKIIFESYVDLLKRKKIVENKNIKDLCEKVWNEPKYKRALEVLFEYKPNKSELILKTIEKIKKKNIVSEIITKINGNTHNYFIKFQHTELLLRLTYNEEKGLGFVIVSEKKEIRNQFEKYTINKIVLKKEKKEMTQYKYHTISDFAWYVIEDIDIDEELIEQIIQDFIDESNKQT